MKKNFYILFIISGIFLNRCSKTSEIENYSREEFYSKTPVPYNYIVYKDLYGYDKNKILYYFHSSDGDEKTWFNSHKYIINEWRKSGKPSPIVIGISFGKRALLIPKNSEKTRSGYLELFIEQIMPEIENNLKNKINERYLFGISIGGANAAQLVFRYPELFKKAALVSPYIYPVSIFSKKEIINNFIKHAENEVKDPVTWIKIKIFKQRCIKKSVYFNIKKLKENYIPDEKTWLMTDIISNIKTPSDNPPEIYISCGLSDENGFYPGAKKLAYKAVSQKYRVSWKTPDGGHFSLNQKEIADFFLNK